MAHMQAKYPNIAIGICRETSSSSSRSYYRARSTKQYGEINYLNDLRIRKSSSNRIRISDPKKRSTSSERQRGLTVLQCSSSTTSSTEVQVEVGGKFEDGQGQFENLVKEYGWQVRRMVEDQCEMGKVAQVQAQAFHVPVLLFNDIFFQFFQAEVLSGLLYRLRNSPPDRYACLVAEPNTDAHQSPPSKELVGVVDVTVLRDEDVLQYLPSNVEEYLYLSGIAVLNNFRRKKVATALLKACDIVCKLWGFEYLVLRAYEDDWGALKLYGNAGYRIISGDAPWMTTWIGRKRRVLMIKQPN